MMMTQVDDVDDLTAWAEKPEEEVLGKNDLASVAAEALERISEHLGNKTTISCTGTTI